MYTKSCTRAKRCESRFSRLVNFEKMQTGIKFLCDLSEKFGKTAKFNFFQRVLRTRKTFTPHFSQKCDKNCANFGKSVRTSERVRQEHYCRRKNRVKMNTKSHAKNHFYRTESYFFPNGFRGTAPFHQVHRKSWTEVKLRMHGKRLTKKRTLTTKFVHKFAPRKFSKFPNFVTLLQH